MGIFRLRNKLALLILFLFLLLFVDYAVAAELIQQSFEVGSLRIKPTFKYTTSFTDNVELANNSDSKYRFTQEVKPGIILQLPLDRVYIETGYQFDYFMVNGYNGKAMHSANGLLRYDLTENTSIGISDDFSVSPLNFSGDKSFTYNTVGASIAQQLNSRVSTGLKYAYETYRGPSSDIYSDYDDEGVTWDMSYRLSPLTTLTPNFDYHLRKFRTANDYYSIKKDYNSYSGQLSISQVLTPRISASVNGGYTDREYRIGDSGSGATYGTGLSARLTNFSELKFDYQHAIIDTFNPLDKETLQSGSDFLNNESIASHLSSEYRQLTTDRITTNLNYKLTDKDIFDFGFTYSWNLGKSADLVTNAATQELREESYTIGLGYSRKLLKWASLSVRGDSYCYKSFGGGLGIDISF
ncbi:MAG: outer membrane beta-barrel protein [Candidatus Omnitrophica bacterium]|nr:outer membrane beta-barrel protein [Candidatus Omnitrophota bacterium]